MKPYFFFTPLLMGGLTLFWALACSTSNPNPTSGTSSTRTNGRILASSETGSALYVLDLQQGLVETQTISVSASPELVISPEGQFALVAQASGNKVDIMKMGTSTATSSSTTTESSTESDDHGHSHGKPRFSSSSSSSTSSSDTSSSSSSSVTQVDLSITGTGLGHVVARGQWMAVQFASKVVAVAEEDLENKLNSISESIVYQITTTLPGVPMDEEHIALGNKVVEIKDGTVLHSGANISGNAILSSNILSLTRSGEGTALFGTDQGLLVVGKYTESGNTVWEDLMVPYPTPSESQIFLAEDEHGHEEGEEESDEEEHGDEHEEVEENRAVTEWAALDGLGHAFAHLTHESHSVGVYRVEAEGLESDSNLSSVFTYLEGTSSTNARPLALRIIKIHEEEEGDEEHSDTIYLLILMSDGSLRIHDAANEGAFVRTISSVITPVTDFHAGENNLPGMTAGLGKVFIGDPSTNKIHQIDLETFQTELTWNLGTSPNRLLLMGESTLSESSSDSHDHN